ncbi:non-canonical purine NTP pyrophosphatase, RdgB/HAM1 family [Arthrobacter sp. MYb224]|uniref:RdgB/HAM1 family non-canonical purine NTP pyrophosphatase n=1 Tax=unclassified Arthrobacter TaxID=235627 RepID=UPI000CFD9A0C|nr:MULTISPECIES: RdgB/HAM1 family non-canonical purine NTP pyrophosphatase [unclassified Arthrobacter]PQZ97086.1 non-canonical purine NTP pyrophosphatase, RdgB/HAM1 family [Arthrobacter sp. MYb224]PRA00053.1 non-canonical purine NTP pyrophosphatase, RdgB/HAM1 family [Arthrobacter sp. MYb229]PRB48273.1 non-canonical purine NTP pyrophosphatase, RdgB/HAM1 family [Arthrobacter sp. MYb216]
MSEAVLVLASRNQGKLRELRELLRGQVPGLDVDTQVIDAATAGAPDPVEDQVTFEGNALKKAKEISAATGLIALADDSGLSVDVLGGAPGIFSARWSGSHGDDEANIDLLLGQLGDISEEHRGAAFVCAAALATPSGAQQVELGKLVGRLRRERAGEHGFGYDPVFQPKDSNRSLAQFSAEEKNSISHRAQAFKLLLPAIITEVSKALAVK